MRLYPLLRILALPVFISYMGVRLVIPEISILGDLFLFNLIPFLLALSVLSVGDRSVAAAILSWALGSTISSWNSLVSDSIPGWMSDAGYLLFYPLLFFGLMRTLKSPREEGRTQLLDSLIIALGLSSILSTLALALTSAEGRLTGYEEILKNFYPIADVLLVATAIVIIFRSGTTLRNLLVFFALSIFAATDITFLIQSAEGSYRFGSLVETGWLIALILLAESRWHRPSDRIKTSSHPLFATMSAALGSGVVIGLEMIEPDRLPNGAMIPAFLTLTLTFIRMSVALSDAQRLSETTYLAKTDELTGLANRRHFISVLAKSKVGDGVVLIDLNEFKPINDDFGHAAGDELLKQVALRLARFFEKDWTFARLGGDEFGLYIPEGSRIDEAARSISAAFSYPFSLTGVGEVSTSASIGVAVEDGQGAALRHADLAMYQAKRSGQPIAFWTPSLGKGTLG